MIPDNIRVCSKYDHAGLYDIPGRKVDIIMEYDPAIPNVLRVGRIRTIATYAASEYLIGLFEEFPSMKTNIKTGTWTDLYTAVYVLDDADTVKLFLYLD